MPSTDTSKCSVNVDSFSEKNYFWIFAVMTTKGTIVIAGGLTLCTQQFLINFYAYVPVLWFFWSVSMFKVLKYSTFSIRRKSKQKCILLLF